MWTPVVDCSKNLFDLGFDSGVEKQFERQTNVVKPMSTQ